MTADRPLDRLAELLAAHADAESIRAIAGRPIAVGWATVELDRAAVELATELGIGAERFLDAQATIALGARCRVGRGCLPDGTSLVLLEPATEGRLAGSLARSGEGPVAVWLAVAALASAVAALREAGIETTDARDGPFGVERLVLDGPSHAPSHGPSHAPSHAPSHGPSHGPYRLLVEPTGTIRP